MMECKRKNRLVIYTFQDRQGIVDRYVIHYLQEMKKYADHILVVVNGNITPEGHRKLALVTSEILVREDTGFYASGYQAGMIHFGWDKLKQYDEVVLTNDSLMGPVCSFDQIFVTMDGNSDLDFWGISKHGVIQYNLLGLPHNHIPEHILASFLVLRRRLFDCPELQEFWKKLPVYGSIEEVTGSFETVFTKMFSDLGYQWNVYVGNDIDSQLTDNILMYLPRLALEKYSCPVFLKKSFYQPQSLLLNNTTGEPTVELFKYLKKKTDYDVDMIWENIIRTCNQSDILRTIGLIYVLPKETLLSSDIKRAMSVALVMHLYYMDILDQAVAYAASMPSYADVIITTPHEDSIAKIRGVFSALPNNVEIRLVENRGRDVSALLTGAADVIDTYEYVAFYHDKKTLQVTPGTVGVSFAYKLSEGLLASKCFVENILYTFEANGRLGMLSPLPPNHGCYFNVMGNEWGCNYETAVKLAREFQLSVPIEREKPPIAPLGTVFWFRASAMRQLFAYNWQYSDFPPEPNGIDGTLLHAIERLYPFFAQEAGFYPAFVVNDHFASIELVNLLTYTSDFGKVAMSCSIYGSAANTVDCMNAMLKKATSKTSKKKKILGYLKRHLPQLVYQRVIRFKEALYNAKHRA